MGVAFVSWVDTKKQQALCMKKQYIYEYCDVLRDLVPFVQFKKREKHPWRSVTFGKDKEF